MSFFVTGQQPNHQYNARKQFTNEPVGLSSRVAATNNYTFDANKLGVLTGAVWSGGQNCTGQP